MALPQTPVGGHNAMVRDHHPLVAGVLETSFLVCYYQQSVACDTLKIISMMKGSTFIAGVLKMLLSHGKITQQTTKKNPQLYLSSSPFVNRIFFLFPMHKTIEV